MYLPAAIQERIRYAIDRFMTFLPENRHFRFNRMKETRENRYLKQIWTIGIFSSMVRTGRNRAADR